MNLREYRASDCERMAELFYETVHSVNKKDYTKNQLDAWASGKVDLDAWHQSFAEHKTFIIEKDGSLVGFGDIDQTGYLNRLYVHKDFQSQGIGTALCDKLEGGFDVIEVHASITAKPFFLRRGYKVVKEQQVERGGVYLSNYVMVKGELDVR